MLARLPTIARSTSLQIVCERRPTSVTGKLFGDRHSSSKPLVSVLGLVDESCSAIVTALPTPHERFDLGDGNAGREPVGGHGDTRVDEGERFFEQRFGLLRLRQRQASASQLCGGEGAQPRPDEEAIVPDGRGAEAEGPLELLPGGRRRIRDVDLGVIPGARRPAPLQARRPLRSQDPADSAARLPMSAA